MGASYAQARCSTPQELYSNLLFLAELVLIVEIYSTVLYGRQESTANSHGMLPDVGILARYGIELRAVSYVEVY